MSRRVGDYARRFLHPRGESRKSTPTPSPGTTPHAEKTPLDASGTTAVAVATDPLVRLESDILLQPAQTPSQEDPPPQMPVPEPYEPSQSTGTSLSSLNSLDLRLPREPWNPTSGRTDEIALEQGNDGNGHVKDTAKDMSETAEELMSGISTFMSDDQWFTRILDSVAQIHPFVAAPILAFKAVYTMERTRRENDKRIIALYVSMKDMIAVLVQLKDVKDPRHVGPDGRTIEARMLSLAHQAKNDIKECANACDTYSKMKLVVKVLKGVVWESRLAQYIARFYRLKAEFQFALAMHTAKAADATQITVEMMHEKLEVLTATIQKMFGQLRPREELLMEAKVLSQGGAARAQASDNALQELLELEYNLESSRSKGRRVQMTRLQSTLSVTTTKDITMSPDMSERRMLEYNMSIKDLRKDLRQDWDTAVERNMSVFQRKFDLQLRDLSLVIRRENSRVIHRLTAGPHDEIQDEELRKIWKDMGWRRNVSAHWFAMTLRDYFMDQVVGGSDAAPDGVLPQKDAAVGFRELPYVQRIREAFDEDGSGYVTLKEVNRFTETQPVALRWNLRRWLAYWTIGWQIAATRYRDRLRKIFARMFQLRHSVRAENRPLIDDYLHKVWAGGVKITESLQPAPAGIRRYEYMFNGFTRQEEERITANLRSVGYNLDALDTVQAVTGPGRLENFIFPLLYLMLKHHLALFRRAQDHVDDIRFTNAANSMLRVYEAFGQRYQQLSTILSRKSMHQEQSTKILACELFEYHDDPTSMWKVIHTQIALDDQTTNANTPDLDLGELDDRLDVLSPSLVTEEGAGLLAGDPLETYLSPGGNSHLILPWFSSAALDSSEPLDHDSSPLSLEDIFGEWNGFVYSPVEYPLFLMTSFNAYATSAAGEFEARGTHYGETYTLRGHCTHRADSGAVQVTFSISYSQDFRTKYFSGYLPDRHTLVGSHGWTDSPVHHQYRFVLKRIPAHIMCRRPSPMEFRANKIAALWKFLRDATLHEAFKTRWHVKFFNERRKTRENLIEYDIRHYTQYGRRLDMQERATWAVKRGAITAVDAGFYRRMRDAQLRLIPKHPDVVCSGCGYGMRGARMICLNCLPTDGDYSAAVSFCDDARCLTAPRKGQGDSHTPAHDFVKVRTVQHLRDMHALVEDAHSALSSARQALKYSDIPGLYGMHHTEEPNASSVESWHSKALLISPPKGSSQNVRSASITRVRKNSVYSSISCSICATGLDLSLSCWFCVDCFNEDKRVFICNECELKTLLLCPICREPYKQPTWYHGARPGDIPACNKCTYQKRVPLTLNTSATYHTYTHPLVRCTPTTAVPADIISDATDLRQHMERLDQRMTGLEDKLSLLLSNMGIS